MGIAISRLAVIAAFVLPLAAEAGGGTRSIADPLETVALDTLKQVYLACDRDAGSSRLSSAGIMRCSMVYEALKRRAFGGDFERLLAWSRQTVAAR